MRDEGYADSVVCVAK